MKNEPNQPQSAAHYASLQMSDLVDVFDGLVWDSVRPAHYPNEKTPTVEDDILSS